MVKQQSIKEERSLGDLFSDLAGETGMLIRQEVALAQVELTEKAANVGRNIGFLVVGSAVGFAAFLALMTALIIGLSFFIPLWLSALIVGTIVGIVAFVLISSALKALKNTDLKPRQTVESLKEDAQWLKNQTN
ncbi:MAG TPA: phage holin family protein [Pyrinomonadaceae bacterium]|nr:phage holin family protein [Pyrinomonadaceae bacterium]